MKVACKLSVKMTGEVGLAPQNIAKLEKAPSASPTSLLPAYIIFGCEASVFYKPNKPDKMTLDFSIRVGYIG